MVGSHLALHPVNIYLINTIRYILFYQLQLAFSIKIKNGKYAKYIQDIYKQSSNKVFGIVDSTRLVEILTSLA